MKPGLFINLPAPLRERLLNEMDYLDYDQYDSSRVACIDEIMNGNCSDTNKAIINSYYQALSWETLLTFAKQELESLNNKANSVTQFIRDISS